MKKPAKLCKLVRGKLIDVQTGFVDTWNWLVEAVSFKTSSGLKFDEKTNTLNLKLSAGTGISLEDQNGSVKISSSGGGGEVKVYGNDGSNATGSIIRFACSNATISVSKQGSEVVVSIGEIKYL